MSPCEAALADDNNNIDKHPKGMTRLQHTCIGRYCNFIISKQPTFGVSTNQIQLLKMKKLTLLWDMQVYTDRIIKANKPDIIIKSKKEKFSMLIDMAVPPDRKTSVKVAQNSPSIKICKLRLQECGE